MQIKQYASYSFDELSDKAKKRAIGHFADINTDFDWWTGIITDFCDQTKRIGVYIQSTTETTAGGRRHDGTLFPSRSIRVPNVYFDGFYSQGSHSAFESTVDVKKLITSVEKKAWKDCNSVDLEMFKFSVNKDIWELLKANRIFLLCKTLDARRGNYFQVSTEIFSSDDSEELNLVEPFIIEQLKILEEKVKGYLCRLNDSLYERLRAEHKYLSSEEAIVESIQCYEYEFDERGEVLHIPPTPTPTPTRSNAS